MAEDISYIRKWIKKGLSKDKRTLDFSNKGIDNLIAEELAENVSLPDIEVLYLHTNKIKDEGLKELANSEIFESLKELWIYENKIGDTELNSGFIIQPDTVNNFDFSLNLKTKDFGGLFLSTFFKEERRVYVKINTLVFYNNKGPYKSQEVKKLSKKEKKILIGYKKKDGSFVPNNIKRIWPYTSKA